MQERLHTMSDKEIKRLEIIAKVNDKVITVRTAKNILNLSKRQVLRLVAKYRKYGTGSLISQKRGKPSNRSYKKEVKKKILDLIKHNYPDFKPTLASEKLYEYHQIKVSKETIRQWMMECGLWKGKLRKTNKIYQQRTRRACFGELIQIDGSPHDWFEGRREKCCLLVFIDDATSRLVKLRFEESETTQGYFNATKSYIKRYGCPLAFYSDKHVVFCINLPEKHINEGETQFHRAVREMGIRLICANTPQAKGRVERANATLQDRLVKELRLRGISDIDTANAYLPEFMVDYNKRFAVEPINPTDVHRKELPSDDVLNMIFSHQENRKLSKQLELSYKNVIYQIQNVGQGRRLRFATVRICDDLVGNIKIIKDGKYLV